MTLMFGLHVFDNNHFLLLLLQANKNRDSNRHYKSKVCVKAKLIVRQKNILKKSTTLRTFLSGFLTDLL